jgi:hypothetical protein
MKIFLRKEILEHAVTREKLNALFDSYGKEKLESQTDYKKYRRASRDLDKFIISRLSLPYVKIQNKDAFVRVDYIIDYVVSEKEKPIIKTWFFDVKNTAMSSKEPLVFYVHR